MGFGDIGFAGSDTPQTQHGSKCYAISQGLSRVRAWLGSGVCAAGVCKGLGPMRYSGR